MKRKKEPLSIDRLLEIREAVAVFAEELGVDGSENYWLPRSFNTIVSDLNDRITRTLLAEYEAGNLTERNP